MPLLGQDLGISQDVPKTCEHPQTRKCNAHQRSRWRMTRPCPKCFPRDSVAGTSRKGNLIRTERLGNNLSPASLGKWWETGVPEEPPGDRW